MKGRLSISISSNAMQAMVCINSNGSQQITEEIIRQELEMHGIKAGVDEDAVRTLPYRAQYGMEYVVAQGKAPEKGSNGYYEFFFDREALINNEKRSIVVKRGKVLATYHPARAGAYGYTIFATMIAPKPTVDLESLTCVNIQKIDNNYVAVMDGELSLDGDQLQVFRHMNITAEKLKELGSMEYDGDVNITGDVVSGIKLSTAGSIYVDGVVEGAELTAGKDIVITYGVHGQDQAKLKAANMIETKFIEDARVEAGDLIRAESLINVSAHSGNIIVATGKTGRIIGGDVVAERCIDAITVGNEQLTYTTLTVRSDDQEKIPYQTIIVRDRLIGKTVVQFGDKRLENCMAGPVEFHLTDNEIQQFEIGKYTYRKKKEKPDKEKQPSILIVDDDPVVLKKEYMDLCGSYHVTAIAKPIDALIYLKKYRPDLILLDYKMPEMSGTELFAKIRKMKECSSIPVYFLTGISSKDVVVECLSMYPQGYLVKPMSKQELLKVVGDFFRENPVEQ